MNCVWCGKYISSIDITFLGVLCPECQERAKEEDAKNPY